MLARNCKVVYLYVRAGPTSDFHIALAQINMINYFVAEF